MSAAEVINGRVIYESVDLKWAIRESYTCRRVPFPREDVVPVWGDIHVPAIWFHFRFENANGLPIEEVRALRDALTRWLGE